MLNPVTFTWSLACPRTLLSKSENTVVASVVHPTLGTCDVRIAPAPIVNDDTIHVGLVLTASFDFEPSRDDAFTRDAAWSILQSVVDTLTFRERLIFDPPIRNSQNDDLSDVRDLYEFHQKHGPDAVRTRSRGRGTATTNGRVVRAFAPDTVGLQQELEKSLLMPDDVFLCAYRAAVEASDLTAEFILHYAILGLLYGDNQVAIDAAIDPNQTMGRIPWTKPKATKPVMETSVTRVRNELAHFKDRGLSLREAAEHAKELAPEIREIVRVHIERKLKK